jgi:hypothetical protein
LRASSRILHHPQGGQLRTPLLIPSFSSRGFDVARRSTRSDKLISECSQYLEIFASRINKAFLVSAYDLNFKLLDAATKLGPRSFGDSLWSHPKMLFIDSGAYECRDGADSHEPLQEMRVPFAWGESDFTTFASKLPAKAPIALVNWDRYESYRAQIDAAQAFFSDHKGFLSIFLLKPEEEGILHDISRLASDVDRLAAFHVIGVTEKELGDSILERMANVARLRDLLDSANVDRPIHLFGALDPLYTPLYFASGAEIFDGLSWLRYLWIEGIPVHRSSLSVLAGHQRKGHQEAIEIALAQSLDMIEQLELRLKNFANEDGDWSVFKSRAAILEDAFLDMEATL